MSGESDRARLLVPIHIDALAVGEKLPPSEIFKWTNLAPDFAKLKTNYFFGSELDDSNNLFVEAAGLEPGVHLHFQLPRALKHGSQEGGADVSFPAIPNRWLVQRIDQSSQLTHKAWLIKSDVGSEENSVVTWPTFYENGPTQFKKIGSTKELTESFEEKEEAALEPPITSVGAGNPSFSAYYPACRGILGFYDPLDGVPEGSRLSYLITGWYSDPKHDPLSAFITEFQEKHSTALEEFTMEQQELLFTELQAWIGERGWTESGLKTDDSPPRFNLPSGLLCHGLVKGLIWEGSGRNYMQPIVFPEWNNDYKNNYEQAYKIAVGNTSAEALAALLVAQDRNQDLLTALQGDMLSQPVTAADLQYVLHNRRFSGMHGGTIHAIRAEPDQPVGKDRSNIQPKTGGLSPIPSSLRKLLLELNEKQLLYDQLSRRLEDCRWLVYSLWYLVTSERKPNGKTERWQQLGGQLSIAREALLVEKTLWDAAKKDRDEWASENKDPQKRTGKMIDELAKYPKTRLDDSEEVALKYRLASSPASPFQKPLDPGIAISGPALNRRNSWQQVEPNKPLCRISGGQVTGLELRIPLGRGVTVESSDLISELFSHQENVYIPNGIHADLLGEALLLDEQYASSITKVAYAVAKIDSNQYRDELTQEIKELQTSAYTSNPFIGHLPDPVAVFEWTGNPWIPLFMVWEVSWQSDYQSPDGNPNQPLPEDLVTSHWGLGDNTAVSASGDLIPKIIEAGNSRELLYEGYSILTPSMTANLAKGLEKLNPSHPLLAVLNTQPVQSQVLDGFNDALLLQKPGMQLPPLDFDEWRNKKKMLEVFYQLDSIHSVLNDGFEEKRDTFRTAPKMSGDPFLPIRAGRLKIQRLAIVDAFGQTLKLPLDKINESTGNEWQGTNLRRAHSCVIAPPGSGLEANLVSALRPRFTQPMRLKFEFVNASTGSNMTDGSVCGWVVPNHLEKNLSIYSASGIPLGALQKKLGLKSGTSEKFAYHWLDVPGGENNRDGLYEQELKEHLAGIIEDVHLRYFCDWVLNLDPDEGSAFSALIDNSMASVDQRVPEEDPGISVLVGRPLALVRASLQFETAGLPAHQTELRADAVQGAPVDDLIDPIGFQKVRWPLRLGDLHARNDGLIGAFQCSPVSDGDPVTTIGPFYPAWGQDNGSKVKGPEVKDRVFGIQDFEVDCAHPLQVTMLMDPQARAHATSGVLPRTFLELPHDTVTGAKRAREVFFQTAPVLGLSASPQMPKPSDDYGEWSWAYRPDVTHWKLDPKIVEATDRGAFSKIWPSISEGWLKLAIAQVKVLSFWVREGIGQIDKETNLHLAWSLQGAESLKLETVEDDGTPTLINEWDAQPFPRETNVTVKARTTYRITAFAEGADPSFKEVTIQFAE